MPSAAFVANVTAGAIMCAGPTMPAGGDGGEATGHSMSVVGAESAPAGTNSERWQASTQSEPPSVPMS